MDTFHVKLEVFRHSEAVYVKCGYGEKFFTDTEVFTLVTFIVIDKFPHTCQS